MSNTKTQNLYLNRAQQEYISIAANTSCCVASRRFGKSFLVGNDIRRNVFAMPGSIGGYVASSYRQAHERTLPSALAALKAYGLYRDIHYIVGKKPPISLGYGVPVVEPDDYTHVVYFFNGTIMIILSQDVPLSANSLTLDWVIVDEAKGIDFDKLKNEVFAANGGTQRYFGECPWHHGVSIFSDMPVGKKGSWILNYREKSNKEVIDTILELVAERHRYTQEPPTEWNNRQLAEIDSLLSDLRRVAVLYREWSIFENIDIVGIDYVLNMKRDLPPLVFQTSILCKRIETLQGGFYPNFNEKIHCYTAKNTGTIDEDYEGSPDCLADEDLDKYQPIAVAFDWNNNINWLVAGQVSGIKLKVISSFYVKYRRKVRELVDDFCHYYRYHITKEVVFYYDTTAIGTNYAVNDKDFASVAEEQFNKNGWAVSRVFIGKPISHAEKYILLDEGFKGTKNLLPLFNSDNNEALIIAMSSADVKRGPRGFQKAKGGEKLEESEEDPLELRTDGTDAFDTLFIGCTLYPYISTVYMGSAV